MRDSGNWPPDDETTTRSWEQRTAQRRRRRSSPLNDTRLMPFAIGAAVVLLIIVGIWLWSGQPNTNSGLRGPTTIPTAPTLTPTPAATPTPAVRRAKIVRLGGGPGLLHESPGFNTPVLSAILKEGDIVELLGREKPDAEGNLWQLVALGDVAGWSPENNLQPLP